MTNDGLLHGLQRLPAGDKRLLKAFIAMAVLALALGLVCGALTGFRRAGFVSLVPGLGYEILSLHGVSIFFYWLYFIQAGLVLMLASVYSNGAGRLVGRPLAWLALALMIAGFALSETTLAMKVPLLYDGHPKLVSGNTMIPGLFYVGYVVMSVGLFLVGTVGVLTALMPKFEGSVDPWSAVTFATVAWAGLLIVSAMAGFNVFLPPMLWAFGLGPAISDYAMKWHVLFHNMHYLPLMATVIIWYVLVETMTGVRSIFGSQFSKVVFASYLILVPPTFLYHMFLDPSLSDTVRVVGSLLSLFIAIPTVLVYLIIVSSLESYARALGGKGLFGWMRMLPWSNPAMTAIGLAAINMAIGGSLSFVLIQERLAPLLSDTFFVPGYFHFLTLGTVTLTFIAALLYVIPGITARPLWRPRLLNSLPYVITFGLLVFGAAGVTAGYIGVPRRVFDVGYGGEAPIGWEPLMVGVGVGTVFMSAGLGVYIYALARMLLRRAGKAGQQAPALPTVSLGDGPIGRHPAWVGPLSVLVVLGAMAVFTVLGFELMQNVPLSATGGGHAHH
jgi:cytochrome c oxidase subunit 1